MTYTQKDRTIRYARTKEEFDAALSDIFPNPPSDLSFTHFAQLTDRDDNSWKGYVFYDEAASRTTNEDAIERIKPKSVSLASLPKVVFNGVDELVRSRYPAENTFMWQLEGGMLDDGILLFAIVKNNLPKKHIN